MKKILTSFVVRRIVPATLVMALMAGPVAAMNYGDGGNFDAKAGGHFGGDPGEPSPLTISRNLDADGQLISLTIIKSLPNGNTETQVRFVTGGVVTTTVTNSNGNVVSQQTYAPTPRPGMPSYMPGVNISKMTGVFSR